MGGPGGEGRRRGGGEGKGDGRSGGVSGGEVGRELWGRGDRIVGRGLVGCEVGREQ